MDPNTWHFTLSALSQTLAAILGLTAIFFVLKVESITKQIDYYKRRGASILKGQNSHEGDRRLSFDADYILQKLHAFARKHREDVSIIPHLERTMKRYDPSLRVTQERAVMFLDDTIYSLEDNMSQKKKIIQSVRVPAVANLITIFIALELLAASDLVLSAYTVYAQGILLGAVALGIMGVTLIAFVAYEMLWSIE